MKKILTLFMLSFIILNGCKKDDSEDSTIVEIIVNDETGTLNYEIIKSIYDPSNDKDFRYSKYDVSKYVKFSNVEPGNYRAHATPVSLNTGNWTDIKVAAGDHYKITFTYFIDGYVTIMGYTAPHYWWKNKVER